MIKRSTVILCLLAIVGVIAAVVVERARPAGARERTERTRRLFAPGLLPIEDISSIRLGRPDEAPLVFERRDDGWWQAEPFEHPMDAYSIRQLAVLAAELKVEPGALRGEPSSAALGIDPPRADLTLNWPGGMVRLLLGRRGVAGRAYLKVDGREEIFIVNQDLHERAVDMNPAEWRDRRIFRNAGVDSDRIEIAADRSEIVLARERRQWRMERPVSSRLNAAAADELFQALGRAQSGGFILDEPEDLSRFGLLEPAGSVTVTSTRLGDEDGEVTHEPVVQRLLIGARIGVASEDRFGLVEGRPAVVRLGAPLLRALFKDPASLVSATGTDVVPADVKTIRISTADGDLRLRRDLERWFSPDFDNRQVSAELVEDLLHTLTEVHASRIALRPYPRDLEVAIITLSGYRGTALDAVRVVRLTDATGTESRWALENGDDVLRIHDASVELRLTPEEYGLAPSP